jgi:hypothetical protein
VSSSSKSGRSRRRRRTAPSQRAATTKPPPESLTQRSIGAVKTTAAVVGAVAAIVGGVVAVVGYVKHESPPKVNAKGRVSEIKLAAEPLSAWARSIGQDPSELGAAANQPGVLVHYRIRIVGYRGENLPMDWTLVDKQGNLIRNGTRVLQPESADDDNTKRLWIPTNGVGHGSVRVRIEVFRPDHRNLIGEGESSLWHR